MDSRHRELDDLKYEYDRAVRERDNLQKNLDRRKKLNLADESYEDEIKAEIEAANDKISDLRTRLRRLQSEVMRSHVISETNERSPWEK